MIDEGSNLGQLARSVLSFIERKWRTFVQCGFIIGILMELSSVVLVSTGLSVRYSTTSASIVYFSMSLALIPVILGVVGFLLADNNAIIAVKEKYKGALQEALGTQSHLRVLGDMSKATRMAERIIIKKVNLLLLTVTVVAGLFSLVYMFSIPPELHPFYFQMPLQMLSVSQAAVFLYGRR